tara:strand:- start:546 stop:911 length:366 start_codon:yes stop_codon:yes gene_type:complete
MLTPIDDVAVVVSATGAVAQSTPDKQICAQMSTTAGTLYVVPEGRKFVGFFGHQYGNNNYYMEVTSDGTSANTIRYYGGIGAEPSNYKSITMVEHTLLAGTTLKNSPSGGTSYILGVESDA